MIEYKKSHKQLWDFLVSDINKNVRKQKPADIFYVMKALVYNDFFSSRLVVCA